MISVAIMGHGVVGSGVAEIITTHKQKLFSSIGEEVYIKHILDLRDFPDSPLANKFTKNFDDILNDVEVRVVAEVMGGITPAYDYTKKLLKAGKSVVTSNKELVAAKGAELLQLAKENNANFLFEASVGGGIPIIRPMNQCLVANNVQEVAGILNGTTNFILTKMIAEGMDFDTALKLAQDLGFAERNPEADVEGHDACRKICILASLAFGKHVYPDNVYTEGITKITLEDVTYATAHKCVIKLIGKVKVLDDGKMDIFVAPMFVPKNSQLANIDNEFNGIMVRGDCTGDVVFYGKGAGKLPTASAVVADIIDCCKHLKNRKYLYWADSTKDHFISHSKSENSMFIRIKTDDADATIKMAKELFGDIEVITTKEPIEGEVAIATPVITVENCDNNVAKLENQGVKVLSKIIIGDL